MIGKEHFGWAPGSAGLCIGQAIAGCAAPSAGSANGPRGSNTTRPETGSVAIAALPKMTSGVDAVAFDQSLPFHIHVAASGATTLSQPDAAAAVPCLAFADALGAGATAGIGSSGGTEMPVEPVEPEDDDPEPPEHATEPLSGVASC
jgi:hypothetical protein